MNAWADGLNYYLAHAPGGEAAGDHALRAVDGAHLQRGEHRRRHREGEPRRSSRRSTAKAPGAPAGRAAAPADQAALPIESEYVEPAGSNGVAIAPSNTAGKHALLLINPHTSFFFRAEAQMVSEEGLNAYGALTWGQFFIYQGFNDRAGWMHTIERRGRHRRVPRDGRQEGRRLGLPLRHGGAAGDRARPSPCRTRPPAACRSATSPSTARTTDRSSAQADGKWVACG